VMRQHLSDAAPAHALALPIQRILRKSAFLDDDRQQWVEMEWSPPSLRG